MDGFTSSERLLALKGAGPTVVARLEQIGIHSLAQLADTEPDDLLLQISAMLGASCWRNSPQARAAVTAMVHMAGRAAVSGLGR
ncbi:helix-hairpin-helix domain-containing protein [Dyella sp. RRB7]|uniref:helix-hairpin-helix domain-containing protein n=1 Tax=Dyella sp. RRB7 TaxID=2919502 RepID=UPI001FAB20F6|nr:helix-hairpin-helix domain-containing protein [Dyella sp. RRB7]